jgi:hypothetical protein
MAIGSYGTIRPSDVSPTDVDIVSTHPCHNVRLNNHYERIIPEGFDIVSFSISHAPEHLTKVHVYIGNSRVVSFDRSDITNLLPQGLPSSLVTYQYVDVELEYCKGYIENNESYEMVDEYEEKIEYSDTEEEFYDGCDYFYGQRVHRSQVPTGRQVRKITEPATVLQPELQFTVKQSNLENNTQTTLPIWEKITIDPQTFDEDYVQRLVDKYQLQTLDGTDPCDTLKKGEPFEAKLRNAIHFSCGMASKVYVF